MRPLPARSIQVAACLIFGAFFRAASFWDFPKSLSGLEEILRVLKDIFWITAFLLIILYWVELQQFAFQQHKRGVNELRPRLYGMILFFTVTRVAQGVAKIVEVKAFLYVCYFLTVSFLACVFLYAQVRCSPSTPCARALCRRDSPR